MKSLLYLGCPASERDETERLLASAGFSVVWSDTTSQALRELQRRDMPALIDLSRGGTVLQAARELRAHSATALVFAVVDARRPDLTTEAVLAGIADVFARPLAGRRVALAIERELGYRRQADGHDRAPGEELYGCSPAMRETVELIGRAAATRGGVLICGEEGSGRRVVARTIHAEQADSGAFVSVDCAAFEGDGLERDLFGTSARAAGGDPAERGLERISRVSRLHEASGGTLYLRNVREAPARAQTRLARVLRDGEAVLADSNATMSLDVRLMAGVGPGLDAALHDGTIHESLYRRLSGIRISLPPLRNRRDDIPALANFFVRQICASVGAPPKILSRSALTLISALPWRGNGAELRELLENVIAGLASGKGIGLEDVLAHMRLDGGGVGFAEGGTLRQARARFERDYIAAVLAQHEGRISDAARALGIQRTNLYRKIRTLRIAQGRRR
ncbi:MAG: sigma-54-dependent transcriptional regulator [Betaproteobacteria bacterium]